MPTDERPHSDDPSAAQRYLRLISELELILDNGKVEGTLHRTLLDSGRSHRIGENLVGIAAIGFSAIHSGIGVAKEGFLVIGALWIKADTNARSYNSTFVIDCDGLSNSVEKFLGYDLSLPSVVYVLQHHHKLVAA